jgi:hypothetical protein
MHAVRAYLEDIWGDAGARFRLLAENTATVEPDDAASTDPGPRR